MGEPLIILGTEFRPVQATRSVHETVLRLMEAEPDRYRSVFDTFFCPFYPGAVIAILYRNGVSLTGALSMMFIKDGLIKRFFPDLHELPDYNKELEISLNSSSIQSFSSCVSCYDTPEFLLGEDRFLREPASLEAIIEAGIPARSLVEVKEVADGWVARSYKVVDDTSNLVFVDFRIPRDGRITEADFEFDISPKIVRQRPLMR